ncbi:hypothetical protein OEIGOIKO_00871 [Streptomyces chrestomyceticus JCM 4735]|uniref:Uncharacterized protein n=1 Tax=Streptomyces chrestomyceticus JCM 4735 TaxID=1306181 RepID=A0A7U9KQU7_9ACTN|nr:hypothetical protein OEIGOIKO_00871 [Streptomyces chrestomyceticus JCM 4735]
MSNLVIRRAPYLRRDCRDTQLAHGGGKYVIGSGELAADNDGIMQVDNSTKKAENWAGPERFSGGWSPHERHSTEHPLTQRG